MLKLILVLMTVVVCARTQIPNLGWRDLVLTAASTKRTAEKALVLYDDGETDNRAQRLLELISAKVKVVGGLRYKFELGVGLMNCTEEESKTNTDCHVNKKANCTLQLFQNIMQMFKFTNGECSEFEEYHVE